MTVDLSTLKVGDKVRSRAGKVSTVTKIELEPESAYPFIVQTTGNMSCGFCQDGSWRLGYANYCDIVEITPKEETKVAVDLSTLEVGDSVVLRNGRIVEVLEIGFSKSLSLYPNRVVALWELAREPYGKWYTDDGYFISKEEHAIDIIQILKKPTEAHTITHTAQTPAEYVSPTGAKRNSVGKAPLGYFPLDLAEGAAAVMAYGAGKYSPGNYRKGFPPAEALHSLMRHVAAVQAAVEADDKDGSAGLLLDAESGQAHIHHVVTSALILVQSMKKEGWGV